MILFKRLNAFLLLVFLLTPIHVHAETKTPNDIALATLDRFMTAFNDQDIDAWAETLNYPHVRFASGTVTTYDSSDAFKDRLIFPALAATGWHHSLWTKRTITLSSDKKVHIDTEFERRNADDQSIGRYRSLYIVTEQNGRWGIQARSSLAP